MGGPTTVWRDPENSMRYNTTIYHNIETPAGFVMALGFKTTTWIVERVVTSLLYCSQSVTEGKAA